MNLSPYLQNTGEFGRGTQSRHLAPNIIFETFHNTGGIGRGTASRHLAPKISFKTFYSTCEVGRWKSSTPHGNPVNK